MDEDKIIGGMFGLESVSEPSSLKPRFLSSGSIVLLSNARCGMRVLTERLKPKQVWVPSYLCGPMLAGFKCDGTTVRFYALDEELRCIDQNWINEVALGDLFFYIDYFGFPFDEKVIAAARAKGAWILEDACHALFSQFVGVDSDFYLYSPRKSLGVPDGGILVANADVDVDGLDLVKPPAGWWNMALSASRQKREFDQCGGAREWFDLYQRAEANSPVGHYAMSELTQDLLVHGGTRAAIADRRRLNYRTLLNELGDAAMFAELPDSVVPLGFPIRVDDRDRVRVRLFEDNIYPPVHWDIQDCIPREFRESHRLSQAIMTLPCDQRYDEKDMKRLVDAFQAARRRT